MKLPLLEASDIYYFTPGGQLKESILQRSLDFFAMGRAQRDHIVTVEQLLERQKAVKDHLINSFGGLPSSDHPLNAQITGVTEQEEYTIEKVIFESRPRHYVTANLYLPRRREKKTPAVLFLEGHALAGKATPRYQNVCQFLARAGMIVLAQDPIGQGERLSYFDPTNGNLRVRSGTGEHDYAGIPCRLVGDTIARYFLHDAMRGLDYLASRPEVDVSRLGVTGNSGGGVQSSLLMATDPRICAAAPGTFIMSREAYIRTGQAQDSEQIWPGFTSAGFDHEDLLLAMAPKPVAVLATKSDFFPIEGTRESVKRVMRFWELCGLPPQIELIEDASVHGFTENLARAAARFFAQHLLGKRIDTSNWKADALPVESLNCTKTGQVSAEFPNAEFVYHATAAKVQAVRQSLDTLAAEARKTRAVEWLKGQVYGPREGLPTEINPRLIQRNQICESFDVDTAFWYPQPHVANLAYLFRRYECSGKKRGVTIAVWPEGSRRLHEHFDWIANETKAGRAVLVLNLSGMGPLLPHQNCNVDGGHYDFYQIFFKLNDDLSWIGDSLAALRTWEVTRAIDALHALSDQWCDLDLSDLKLYGAGKDGMYTRLASIVDSRVTKQEWEAPFRWRDIACERYYNTRNIKSFILPGALNYFDLDDF